jgi:hypothetical protein
MEKELKAIRKQGKHPIGWMKTKKSFFLLFSFFFFLFTFLSCQTAPKIIDAMLDDAKFFPLDPGAPAYIYADVQSVKPFIEFKDKQLQQMVNQTQHAVAALYLPEYFTDVTRHYQLAAWGNYPASKARVAFGASKGWKKNHSDIAKADYWSSAQNGLSVAMTAERAFVSAATWDTLDTPFDPFSAAPGTAVPEGFNEFRKSAIIACWFEKPAPFLNRKLGEMGIPLEIPAKQLFFCLFPASKETAKEQSYEAQLRIEVVSAAQARALTNLFAIARGFLMLNEGSSKAKSEGPAALAAMLFANPPVQNDKYLNIKIGPLNGKDISLLFNMFSVY